jgi:hypothetical protein
MDEKVKFDTTSAEHSAAFKFNNRVFVSISQSRGVYGDPQVSVSRSVD